MTEHTIEQLLAEIRDMAQAWAEGYEACQNTDHNPINEPSNPYKAGQVVFKNCTLELFDGTIVPLDNTKDVRHIAENVIGVSNQRFQARFSDENVNPEVYRVEDGHTFEVSPWPSMKDRCHLCGHPETMHIQR